MSTIRKKVFNLPSNCLHLHLYLFTCSPWIPSPPPSSSLSSPGDPPPTQPKPVSTRDPPPLHTHTQPKPIFTWGTGRPAQTGLHPGNPPACSILCSSGEPPPTRPKLSSSGEPPPPARPNLSSPGDPLPPPPPPPKPYQVTCLNLFTWTSPYTKLRSPPQTG